MFNSIQFAGGHKGFHIIKGEERGRGGVVEMPKKKLPGLEAEFGGEKGKKSDRPRLINLLG